MKVLLIAPLPPPAGGIASWTERYLNSVKAKENNVFVVNTAVTGKRAKDYSGRNIRDEFLRTCEILSDVKRQLRESKIDVVHLTCSCGKFGSLIRDYLCVITVAKSKVRLITHFHCDVSYMVSGKTDRFFFSRIVKLSDAVLTLNERSKLFTFTNCNKTSINMPNFLSDEYLESIPEVKVTNNWIKTVLYAGYVKKEKGCDIIYKTALRYPEIRFILLGRISGQFKKAAAPDNIHLLGEVSGERVKTEMLNADLFLFPTHTEGFPNVILEAMACGLPIISTPVGAIPDMIEKKGGILVPINDEDAVAEAFSILENKALREEIAAWNRQKVKNSYTASIVMNLLYEVYVGGI